MEVSTGDTTTVIRNDRPGGQGLRASRPPSTATSPGPGKGLGEGGERLHYLGFGGPWSCDRSRPVKAGTGRAGVVRLACRSHGFCGRRSEHVRGSQPLATRTPGASRAFIVTHRAEDLGGVAVTPGDSPCRVSVPPQCPRIIDSSRFGPFPTNNEGWGESRPAERQCSTNIALTRRNSDGASRVPVALPPHFRSEKLTRNA